MHLASGMGKPVSRGAGMLPPPGKHWQFPPSKLDEFDASGEIFWSANGNPRRKVYLDESAGVGVQDIWMDFSDAHNQNICITGYPTEKNPDLLTRIVEASSNPERSGSRLLLWVWYYACRRRPPWSTLDRRRQQPRGDQDNAAALRGWHSTHGRLCQPGKQMNGKRRERTANTCNRCYLANLKTATELPKFTSTHTPVLDFALIGETHLGHVVADTVATWQQRWSSELVATSMGTST